MAELTFNFDLASDWNRQLSVLENSRRQISLGGVGPLFILKTLHQDLGCNTPGRQVSII